MSEMFCFNFYFPHIAVYYKLGILWNVKIWLLQWNYRKEVCVDGQTNFVEVTFLLREQFCAAALQIIFWDKNFKLKKKPEVISFPYSEKRQLSDLSVYSGLQSWKHAISKYMAFVLFFRLRHLLDFNAKL